MWEGRRRKLDKGEGRGERGREGVRNEWGGRGGRKERRRERRVEIKV